MQDGDSVVKACGCVLERGRRGGMKMHGTRVNWVGMTGAVVLFGYGWWREPLAAVLGGMILLADLLAMEVSVRKRNGKNTKNTMF